MCIITGKKQSNSSVIGQWTITIDCVYMIKVPMGSDNPVQNSSTATIHSDEIRDSRVLYCSYYPVALTAFDK